jgi:arylsulfatase A-like enzyme
MPEQYKGRYDTSNISVPVNFMPKHPFNNGELKIRDEMLASFPRDPAEIKIHIRDYYAMLSHMDDEIGKIIQSLKESGLYENTIIVLAGDNGLALGQHGLMGKQNLYEHSIKVPLIFSGRNIPKGQINTSFVYTMDIFPTICNLTNITVPPSVQGKVILGKKVQQRTSLFYAYRDFQRAVRKGDWKMIVYQVKGQETIQLFNVKKDPFELNDLANDHHYTNKLVEMKLEMSSQKELNNDTASVKIN